MTTTKIMSGMSVVDTASRRWASAAAVQKIMNAAVKSEGSAKVLGLNMDRMRALGLDDEIDLTGWLWTGLIERISQD
ncbi:hypothetical protein MKK50_22320 [Methylobacterium sp. J-043]|uniref:hypothetical protein n=1 Tax=Methylorubrum TaxID=2282523 RepID=UPI00209CCEF4|nr:MULTISPECIES: hypothetical protein [Methylorubrum]MCJ2032107.1 hypothetical protein [Methylobacterium sp. J-043]MCP1551559.1 hypothetical protein [Methylorubrum zatmanii]MCP1556496.1 hypothetical protein [Methylorubrum extorquens]MCP1581843.1 hypothetical protein [Methylorubrum extorquens]